jgi:hypothetical protein
MLASVALRTSAPANPCRSAPARFEGVEERLRLVPPTAQHMEGSHARPDGPNKEFLQNLLRAEEIGSSMRKGPLKALAAVASSRRRGPLLRSGHVITGKVSHVVVP